MEELKWGDNQLITYELRPNIKSKRIKITIVKDQVKVSFPKGTDIKKVKEFVELKKGWIINTIDKYKSLQAELPVKRYLAGDKFLFRGKSYILKTTVFDGVLPIVRIENTDLWVYLSKTIAKENWPRTIKEALEEWYKDQARKIFQERLGHYSKIMDLEYNQLRIKNQKTRWGSCSTKGNINLNWRIIMAPNEVIDYLIVHELSHLKYMDHSVAFWKMVEKFLPDYAKWRGYLKKNGPFLTL